MTESRTIYPAAGRIAGAADQFSPCRTVTNTNSRGLELTQIDSMQAQALFPGGNSNISVRERIMFRTNEATADSPLPRLTPSRPRAVRSSRAEPVRAEAKHVRNVHKVV
ncbi:hypothetical protein [Bradyrhizobium sp. CCBAU 11357]|uniref:hypothetical protein n=1 Tax=Bradyrhizobium sp. CCBAU 11357 TaxID=1630808 RepID=UPI002303217A|nr:hypothetical protein [Bradyrhizobium sp. CCBAU 11357]